MSVFLDLAYLLRDLLGAGGYPLVFLAMFIEGIIVPIPSAAILPFMGLEVARGNLNLALVILVAAAGATAGSTIAYLIGWKLGRPFLLRYGKYLRIEAAHLDKADAWFARWGMWAVLLGNSFTGFRSIISFPAGIARMDLRLFIPFTFVGATVWTSILVLAGFFLGDAAFALAESLEAFDVIVLGGLAVLLLGFFLFRRWRKAQAPSAPSDPQARA